MATWHQRRNEAAQAALWRAERGLWKCVRSSRDGAFAVTFSCEKAARVYHKETGCALIAPAGHYRKED